MDYDKYKNTLDYNSDRQAYRAENSRLTDLFTDDLAQEYDLPRDHPSFDKVFALAWAYGHSAGLAEVEIYFSDLVELVRP